MVVPELPDEVQPWTSKRRAALVLSILRGETSVEEAARAHGLTVGEIEAWQDRYLQAGDNALRWRPRDEEGQREEELRRVKQKLGALVLDNDILKEALKQSPLARRSSEE